MAMTMTTFSALRNPNADAQRPDRQAHGGDASRFNALLPQSDARPRQEARPLEPELPTPVPSVLRGNPFGDDIPTPPPRTTFDGDGSRSELPTPVPTVPKTEDPAAEIPTPVPRTFDAAAPGPDTPTPVPTVPTVEDAADLTNKLLYSLLTGTDLLRYRDILPPRDGSG